MPKVLSPAIDAGRSLQKADLKTEYASSTRREPATADDSRRKCSRTRRSGRFFSTRPKRPQAPFLVRALRSEYWEQRLSDAQSSTGADPASIVLTMPSRSGQMTLEEEPDRPDLLERSSGLGFWRRGALLNFIT